jgi:chromosome partitioning protein
MLGVSRETGGATAGAEGGPEQDAVDKAQGSPQTAEGGAPVMMQPEAEAPTKHLVATEGSTGSMTVTGTVTGTATGTESTSGSTKGPQDESKDESGSAAPEVEGDEETTVGQAGAPRIEEGERRDLEQAAEGGQGLRPASASDDDGAQTGGDPLPEAPVTQAEDMISAAVADPTSADLGDADLNTEAAAVMDSDVDPAVERASGTDSDVAADMNEVAEPDVEGAAPGATSLPVHDQPVGPQEGSGGDLPTPSGPVDNAVDETAKDPRTEQEIAANRAGDNSVDGAEARIRFDNDHADRADREALAAALPTPGTDTPLAMELADNARRRIQLTGRQFPRPVSPRVLTVANQKGGVGKTTTTVNVAAALAQAGLKVLVIDLDPQGNASTALGIDHHAEVPSIYDVLVDGIPMLDVVQPCTTVENLHCAPATIDLAGAEIELVSLVARESRLQKAIAAAAEAGHEFDYILIDCPPSLGLLTVNAMVAASEVFIPIQCEYYALEGLSQLLKNIDLIKRHLNPTLHVSTILLTMYDGRTRLSAQVADEVREHFPKEVLRTTVPRSVRVSEAPSFGETVMTYDPASSGALAYLEAAGEIADRGAAGDT